MSKLKKLKKVVSSYSPYDFDVSVKEVIDDMQSLIDTFGEDVYFDYNSEWNGEFGSYEICIDRFETKQEQTSRLNKEQVFQKKVYEKEQKEYERLKKQFG